MSGSENPEKKKKMNIQTVMYGPMTYGTIFRMWAVSEEAFVDFLSETDAVPSTSSLCSQH